MAMNMDFSFSRTTRDRRTTAFISGHGRAAFRREESLVVWFVPAFRRKMGNEPFQAATSRVTPEDYAFAVT